MGMKTVAPALTGHIANARSAYFDNPIGYRSDMLADSLEQTLDAGFVRPVGWGVACLRSKWPGDLARAL